MERGVDDERLFLIVVEDDVMFIIFNYEKVNEKCDVI